LNAGLSSARTRPASNPTTQIVINRVFILSSFICRHYSGETTQVSMELSNAPKPPFPAAGQAFTQIATRIAALTLDPAGGSNLGEHQQFI
jgi:hypothetical protein